MILRHEERDFINIVESIEDVTGVSRMDFAYKKTRKQYEVLLRTMLIYFCRDKLSWTLMEIQERLGFKNHTTIIHALRKVDNWHDMPHIYQREIKLFNALKEKYGKKHSEVIRDSI